VTTGDSYYLEIPGVQNAAVQITYTRDSGPIEVFGATLDGAGRAKFDVSRDTPKGLYRFDSFNLAGHSKWLQAEATLLVH
jgi:hypothetical protein